jgi:hypothetical protein
MKSEYSIYAQGFKDKEPGRSETLLLDHVENYFISGIVDPDERIRATDLSPIYFQHAGEARHSSLSTKMLPC